MGIVYVQPLTQFQYARNGVAEVFAPGMSEDGQPYIHEFQEHQARNIEARGWGVIVGLQTYVVPEDPQQRKAFEDAMDRQSVNVVEMPAVMQPPALVISQMILPPQAQAAPAPAPAPPVSVPVVDAVAPIEIPIVDEMSAARGKKRAK